MAKKTLEQLEADEQKLIKQLDEIRQGKKDVAKAEADEAKTILQDSLAAFNKLANAAGVNALRLISDAERAGAAGGKQAVVKRRRLDPETTKTVSDLVVKAVKARGKDGANKADIIKYLQTSGYTVGVQFKEPKLFEIITNLRGGAEPEISTVGAKAAMRYVLAK